MSEIKDGLIDQVTSDLFDKLSPEQCGQLFEEMTNKERQNLQNNGVDINNGDEMVYWAIWNKVMWVVYDL